VYSEYTNSNSGNTTSAFILFNIKGSKVYPADQISKAILSGDFPTAYALMMSEASGTVTDSNGNQLFVNTLPIFAGNTAAYVAMTAARNGVSGHDAGVPDASDHASDSVDVAHASADGGK
jgi:hypothetical protein